MLRQLLDRIYSAIVDIASYIWGLPLPLRIPVIGVLIVFVPAVTIVIGTIAGSVAIALTPPLIVMALLWYLATQSAE